MELNGSKLRYKCYLMLVFLGGVAITQIFGYFKNGYNYTYNHGLIGFCFGYILTFLCVETPKLDIFIDDYGVTGIKAKKWYKPFISKELVTINFVDIDKMKTIKNNGFIHKFFRAEYIVQSKSGDFIRISDFYYGSKKSKEIYEYIINKV